MCDRRARLSEIGGVVAALLALGPGQAVFASVASAATITVTTTADETAVDGHVSLREALQSVNAGMNINADVSASGSYGANDTISVPSNASHYTVSTGELPIAKPVVIQGAGASGTTIDAGGTSRVFHVSSGVGSTGTVTFQDLTITGGNTAAEPGGGGILADSGSGFLNFVNATVSGNTANIAATTSLDGGGGVYSSGNTITVTNSTFTGNTATVMGPNSCCPGFYGGGAIYQLGDGVLVYGSTLTGNGTTVTAATSATGGGDSGGGAIYNAGSSGSFGVKLVNTTVGGSGAAANTATLGTMADPLFHVNNGGGGVYNDAGDLVVSGSSVTGNTTTVYDVGSSGGGGLFENGLDTLITNSTVSGNTATASDPGNSGGGGLYNNSARTAFITNASFSDNATNVTGTASSSNGGGAIYNNGGRLILSNATVGNTTPGGTGLAGGNTATIDGGIGGNEGGGGIFDVGNDTDTLIATTVSGNVAHVTSSSDFSGGGGIYELGPFSYSNSTISDNSTDVPVVTATGGGGVYLFAGSGSFANVTLAGNSATASAGGGVFNWGGTLQSQDTVIAQNTSDTGGANCDGSSSPTFQSLGYNLEDSANTCDFAGTGDIVTGGSTVGLGPLGNYGGPTLTSSLLLGSAAIDAGDPSGCHDPVGVLLATDQRGIARADRCDIGAYEFSPPVNSSPPLISGTTLPGQRLNCFAGLWSGSPISGYAYQWNRDGAAIPGANGSTYTVTSSDAGHQLTCTVAATNVDGSTSATSAPVGVPVLSSTSVGSGPPSSPPAASGLPLQLYVVSTPQLVGQTIRFTVLCVGAQGQTCKVVVVLKTTEKLRRMRVVGLRAYRATAFKHVTVGTATVLVSAGKTRTVSIRLNATGRALLAGFGKLPVRAAITLVGANGGTLAVINTKFTITKNKPRTH